MPDLHEDLRLAIDAARQAGAATLRWFGTDLDVTMKGDDQPLTAADLEADALLKQTLAAARPDYGWLSEESADGPDRLGRRRVWIVDPIDGTRSFVARRPEFTISVGLAEDGAPVVGVVYNPARDELFHAVRGGGAFLVERGGPARRLEAGANAAGAAGRRLMLASRTELAAGEFEPFHGDWTVEPQGSTAYKLALVAAGRADAFLSRGPKSEWDVCAGVLIVEESGARATDVLGRVPPFNRADPCVHGIVSAAPDVHDELLRRVALLPPTERMRRMG